MDCTTARTLIDQGLQPGSQAQQNAALGFHLAQCPACRDYRQQQNELLLHLLAQAPDAEVSATSRPLATPSEQPQQTVAHHRDTIRRPKPSFWLGRMALLVLIPIVGLFWLGNLLQASLPEAAEAPQARLPTTSTLTPTLTKTPTRLPSPPIAPIATATRLSQATPTVGAMSGTAEIFTPTTRLELPTPFQPGIEWLPSVVAGALAQATAPAGTPTPSPFTDEPSQATPPPPRAAATILLLGHDLRPGEQDIPRTDALMLVHIDPQRQRIALLSLPRDLWVEIPGYGENRINAAYRIAELQPDAPPGVGLGVARITVSTLLNIPVDYVVLTGFEGFIEIIDHLGGITVQVEKELYDDSFPTMDYGYTIAHFQPGPQRMDGATALTYSRIRHPDSDFMRIRRQQAVLIGIGLQLRAQGTLQNVTHLHTMLQTLQPFVETDMPAERMLGLAWALRAIETDQVESYTVRGDMVIAGVGGDPYALVAIPEALNALTQQFLGTP